MARCSIWCMLDSPSKCNSCQGDALLLFHLFTLRLASGSEGYEYGRSVRSNFCPFGRSRWGGQDQRRRKNSSPRQLLQIRSDDWFLTLASDLFPPRTLQFYCPRSDKPWIPSCAIFDVPRIHRIICMWLSLKTRSSKFIKIYDARFAGPSQIRHYLFCVCTHCLLYQIAMHWPLKCSQLDKNREKRFRSSSNEVWQMFWRGNSGVVVMLEVRGEPRRIAMLMQHYFRAEFHESDIQVKKRTRCVPQQPKLKIISTSSDRKRLKQR